MQDEKLNTSAEIRVLGRGIARTILRDTASIVGGALLGAVFGFVIAVGIGWPFWSGIKLGALVGAIIGLTLRSLLKPLFDYDSHRASQGPNKQ